MDHREMKPAPDGTREILPDWDTRLNGILADYRRYMENQEKSRNTIEKYLRDVRRFLMYACCEYPEREVILRYKAGLKEHYQLSSANSMLMAVNHYLKYKGLPDRRVGIFRQQRKMFSEESRQLDRREYERLVVEARKRGRVRLAYILQTIGMTGIRVGELAFITAEALKQKTVRIHFKNKERVILLPKSLRNMLEGYCRRNGIRSGSIFTTRNGLPLDRRTIWAEMKKLCQGAGVAASKVFPHNLRHLFAKCFYEKEKDLVRLADYLGHSSLETTRRYTIISSMEACMRQLELGLDVGEGADRTNPGEWPDGRIPGPKKQLP